MSSLTAQVTRSHAERHDVLRKASLDGKAPVSQMLVSGRGRRLLPMGLACSWALGVSGNMLPLHCALHCMVCTCRVCAPYFSMRSMLSPRRSVAPYSAAHEVSDCKDCFFLQPLTLRGNCEVIAALSRLEPRTRDRAIGRGGDYNVLDEGDSHSTCRSSIDI